MEEKKTITSAAAAGETIASIRKLMETVGNDDELKQKLEDTLAALTGKSSVSKEEQAPETSSEEDQDDIHENEEKEEEDDDEDEVSTYSSGTDFSDIFTEDAIAGMVVGFVAGAAVVGGGVLLHKLLK